MDLSKADPDLPIHCVVAQNWNEFLLVIIVKTTAVKQQISKIYLQIQPTDASDHVYVSQWPVINARRPASADRTARRQFQATGQPVSRTQAIDAMTSLLPPYEARCVQRRCFQCRPVPCVQISRERSYPCQYIDTTRKAIDCATTLPLAVFI